LRVMGDEGLRNSKTRGTRRLMELGTRIKLKSH
jgi:hypothetical protein